MNGYWFQGRTLENGGAITTVYGPYAPNICRERITVTIRRDQWWGAVHAETTDEAVGKIRAQVGKGEVRCAAKP